jgi:hypothetical protein
MRVCNLSWRDRLACLGAAVLVAMLLASCAGDSKTGAKDDGCSVPDTPDNLIQALACAYETKDLDFYESLLHDDYLFVFLVDVADSLGLPPENPWWGKTADVHSTANLFADDAAGFTILFDPVSVGWTPTEVARRDTVYAGLFRRYMVDLRLHLEEAGGEPYTLIGDDTFLDIVVAASPLYAGHYAVLEMEEVYRNPRSAPLTPPLTLSAVKAAYE